VAKLSFTIEDQPDGKVQLHLEQDLPFDKPETGTPAEKLAMFVFRFIEKQDQRALQTHGLPPVASKLILPAMGLQPVKANGRRRG
jgi:hypothetical protein